MGLAQDTPYSHPPSAPLCCTAGSGLAVDGTGQGGVGCGSGWCWMLPAAGPRAVPRPPGALVLSAADTGPPYSVLCCAELKCAGLCGVSVRRVPGQHQQLPQPGRVPGRLPRPRSRLPRPRSRPRQHNPPSGKKLLDIEADDSPFPSQVFLASPPPPT